MPSAQHVEIEEPLEQPAGGDLSSLLGAVDALNIRKLDSLHGRGSVLFSEGESARGIYILRTGRATVSISSSEGRVVILRMAHAGDVLGLNAVLRNCAYEATVKTLEPARVNFISRAELLELLDNSDAGALSVIKLLSRELSQLTDRARSLLLPQTARARLAQLLLQWSKEHGNNSRSRVIDKVFTHEEVAQMIGSSRETVTRILASLSRRQVIRTTSDSIFILDPAALNEVARDVRHIQSTD
ncbi:MAG TPA: Crp/Fnr family transcriptional regulator [Pyrinomonadaceae bacterium]|nr:Crp/Fnr family transcriptional regulator [Pyrinomonadaceae bacterium]